MKKKNTKDIFTAFGLRNTHIHFRPFEKLQHFWAIQFADFFAVSDYGVPGYVPPAIIIDLRVHFTNVFLGYDHSSIMPNSPFQLKLEIGSSYISTYFMERMERLKLDCIFEDMNMWMRKKVPQSVKFDTSARFCKTANNYVKILMSDSIHFVTAYSFVIDQAPGPIIDFACTDQNLALWLCTDTVIEFFNILKEISNSDIITNLMTTFKKPQDGTQEKRETHDASENTIFSNEKQPENGAANGTMRSNVSFNEEERLIRDMEAAINDMPVACHTNRKKHIEEAIIDDEEFSSQSASENADDPFIMINMIPTNKDSQKRRIGITQIGRFQTHFDTGGDFEFVATHVNISSANQQAFDGAADSSTILISYKMKISSLTIHLFGGSDFADSAHTLPQKSYSQYDSKRDNGILRAIGSEGGRYRDHTVFLEIKFTKLSSICNIFNESSNFLSSMMIELGDFSIIDHLSVSLINEMIHRLEIEGEPKSSGPFLKFTLNQDKLREAVVKISLAPIRINLDQDTFDFFVDYKNELAQGLNNVFDAAPIPFKSNEDDGDVPVMELPKTLNTEEEEYIEGHASDFMNENLYPDLSKNTPISFTQLMEREEATNLDELFSEEDVILSDSFIEEKNNSDRVPNVQAEKSREASQDEGHVFKESQPATSNMANKKGLAAKATFIKDFSFSPACRLRIDYEAKSRIRTDQQGLFLAFLIGMTNLKKTELILKEIRTEKGFLGFGRCAQHVVEEWTNDITNKQLKNVVGGVAVINALVQLGQGFKDLVVSPLEEYQRVDGQVARGIHKGTASFGLNAATAALDATQRVVNLVQNIAELTYDILNPNFAYQQNSQQIQHIPGDLREGISLACDTFREGFVGTAQTFQTAAEQERACGGWGVGIIRHITPTAIKPIVIMSKATSHVLGGLKNQLKPDEHKEEMRKWRHNAVTKQDQFRRQSSSSFHQSSSSNGSSCNGTYDISNRKNW